MKTLQLFAFAIIAALLALLSINFGDLSLVEQLIVGTSLGFISGLLSIAYNFIMKPKINLTIGDKVLVGSIAGFITILVAAIV
jgi:hypothetical protein